MNLPKCVPICFQIGTAGKLLLQTSQGSFSFFFFSILQHFGSAAIVHERLTVTL